MPTTSEAPERHVERMLPSLPWWLLTIGFVAVVTWVLLVALPVAFSLAVGLLLLAGGLGLLGRLGSLRLEVGPGALRIGRAHLESPHLGAVTALDRDQWREALVRGGADRAFLMTRPWIDRGVRVEVDDPADPTPYWLVATRYPVTVTRVVGHTGDITPAAERTADGSQEEGVDDDSRPRRDVD